MWLRIGCKWTEYSDGFGIDISKCHLRFSMAARSGAVATDSTTHMAKLLFFMEAIIDYGFNTPILAVGTVLLESTDPLSKGRYPVPL